MSSLLLLNKKQKLALELVEENWEPISYQCNRYFSFPEGGDVGKEIGGGGREEQLWTAIILVHVFLSHWIIEIMSCIIEICTIHRAIADINTWMNEKFWVYKWRNECIRQNQAVSTMRLLPGVMWLTIIKGNFLPALQHSRLCLWGSSSHPSCKCALAEHGPQPTSSFSHNHLMKSTLGHLVLC